MIGNAGAAQADGGDHAVLALGEDIAERGKEGLAVAPEDVGDIQCGSFHGVRGESCRQAGRGSWSSGLVPDVVWPGVRCR